MIQSKRTVIFLFMLGVMFSQGAGAHVSRTCLKVVEQAARDLKTCEVKKSREACSAKRDVLSKKVAICTRQQFSNDDIVHAVRSGESRIAGNASYYLEPVAADAEKVVAEMGKGNQENFTEQFPFVESFPMGELYHGANQGGCRDGFLAVGERYNFLGQLDFKKYDEKDLDIHKPYTLYFFNKMVDGTCYQTPLVGQRMANGDRTVVNLPVKFFEYLERGHDVQGSSSVIIRCNAISTCNDIKHKKLKIQVDYQATYLRIKRLEYCKKKASGNVLYRALKVKRKKEDLPSYCQDNDPWENLPKLRETLNHLGNELYGS